MTLTDVMLELVRAAVLDRDPEIPKETVIDWDILMDLSKDQGLIGWVWDGICRLPEEQQPPRGYRINWGMSAQEIWDRYDHHKKVLDEMVEICQQNDMRLLLLKGLGLSALYPKPQSRPSGDIDIYLFDDGEKGSRLLAQGDVKEINRHAVFWFHDVRIENHHTFLDVDSKGRKKVDAYLQSTLPNVVRTEEGYYLLEPMANLVFVIMHSINHLGFGGESLSLRSIIDLPMLIRAHQSELTPEDCYRVMNDLGISHCFELLVYLGEWALGIDMSTYHKGLVPASDLAAARNMIFEQDYIKSVPEGLTFWGQLKLRAARFRQIRWKYRYYERAFPQFYFSIVSFQYKIIKERIFGCSAERSS